MNNMEPTVARVRELMRTQGHGLHTARNIAKREVLLDAVESCTSFNQLKAIVHELVKAAPLLDTRD